MAFVQLNTDVFSIFFYFMRFKEKKTKWIFKKNENLFIQVIGQLILGIVNLSGNVLMRSQKKLVFLWIKPFI